MTPAAVQITTVLITAVATVLASFFARAFVEWRKGKKNEAQRLESAERKAELYREEYNYFRAWVLAEDVLSPEQLERIPRTPDREEL